MNPHGRRHLVRFKTLKRVSPHPLTLISELNEFFRADYEGPELALPVGGTGVGAVIVLSRVDSRLIHGQVVEAWLPYLNVRRVVVADDEVAGDDFAKAAMGLAVPPSVEVVTQRIESLDFSALASDSVRTMVLFRDVSSVMSGRQHGLPDGLLNLGNVHAGPGRSAVSRSVYLSIDEREQLEHLGRHGMQIVIQAVPGEKPTGLAKA